MSTHSHDPGHSGNKSGHPDGQDNLPQADETGRNALPEGAAFEYYLTHEQWYASHIGTDRKPEIMVCAAATDGGVHWEFGVRVHDLGQYSPPAIRAEVFDDAFAAFAQIPAFFAALAKRHPRTLDEVRDILNELGGVDRTDRHGGPERVETEQVTTEQRAALIERVDAAIDRFAGPRAVAQEILRERIAGDQS